MPSPGGRWHGLSPVTDEGRQGLTVRTVSCLPLGGRWLGFSRDGGSVPGSIGHSPSLPLRAASPLSEGAKAPVRLPERLTAERKPSPWGKVARAFARDGCGVPHISEQSEYRTGSPPHPSRAVARATLCKQERASLRGTDPVLLRKGFPWREGFSQSGQALHFKTGFSTMPPVCTLFCPMRHVEELGHGPNSCVHSLYF